jgi:anti-sigma B factor antagonist
VAGEDFGSARVVRLPDEIDIATGPAAEAELLAAVSVPGLVIADMTGTTCCDSANMRMLLAIHQRAQSTGSTLRVAVRPGSSVARVMTILGVRRLLSVFDSVADARTACGLRPVRTR